MKNRQREEDVPVGREKARVRIMCLDVGDKTIGIALSDELGLTAQPFQTLRRKGIERDLDSLRRIVERRAVSCIVVGLPVNMDGTTGRQAQRVRGFSERIEACLGIKVVHWDERLSTAAAERVLLEAGLTREKRRKHVDKVAATVILQGYLDAARNRGASAPGGNGRAGKAGQP